MPQPAQEKHSRQHEAALRKGIWCLHLGPITFPTSSAPQCVFSCKAGCAQSPCSLPLPSQEGLDYLLHRRIITKIKN